jgi:hypothetical protein
MHRRHHAWKLYLRRTEQKISGYHGAHRVRKVGIIAPQTSRDVVICRPSVRNVLTDRVSDHFLGFGSDLHLWRPSALARICLDEHPTGDRILLLLLRRTQPRNPFALEALARNRESAMVRDVDHRDRFDAVVRANRVMALSLLWSALATCAISSLVYDVGHWLNAW